MPMTKNSSIQAILIIALLLMSIGLIYGQVKPAEELFKEASDKYSLLLNSPSKLKMRGEWERCIGSFREIVVLYPAHSLADDALFKLIELYLAAYHQFQEKGFQDNALLSLKRLIDRYPQSPYAEDSLFTIGEIYFSELKQWRESEKYFQMLLQRFPSGKRSEFVKKRIDYLKTRLAIEEEKRASQDETAIVKKIRHWSGEAYTRVVIDLDQEVAYKYKRLFNPDRIYFDLLNSSLSSSLSKKSFPVKDEFLRQVRVGQNKIDVVRVVLDFANISDYRVFSLYNPDRVVIDILGRGEGREVESPFTKEMKTKPPSVPKPSKEGKYTLARQLALGVGTIVIDPGHGGDDPGAIGRSGLKEKSVALDIALRMQKILEKEIGCRAILTRKEDTFIPLEERTAIANASSADLFLSIHTNANHNKHTRGIETYFLNFATTPEAEAIAARENAISQKNMAKLQELVKKITLNTKIDESKELARFIQSNMKSYLRQYYKEIVDLGVKQAPFYVLIGANMPSVLVEVSFITHSEEEKLLKEPSYRQRIAEAICSGIKLYIQSLS